MRMQKGSFTIEAIMWIPLMLGLMIYTLSTGLSFYKERVTCDKNIELTEWDAVSEFYDMWLWKEIGEGGEDE